jgi:sialic acid synthase
VTELVIDGKPIADDCYVIAEIGHNHGGSVDTAKEMFLAAKWCGCDAVKLQKRDNKTLYTAAYYNSPYHSENAFGRTYGEHREALEFNGDQYLELQRYAKEIGITFFATAFDRPSVDFLAALDVPAIKIASGDCLNFDLLEYASEVGIPLIVSTGGVSLEDVMHMEEDIAPDAILHCTSGYPAKFEELNLNVITSYLEEFPEAVIGWSAHDTGTHMAIAAYVLGARIIEKHFTLNRASKGTDHAMSLEPHQMAKMVKELRRLKEAMGDGVKRRYGSEVAALSKQWKNEHGQIDGLGSPSVRADATH